MSNHLSGHLSLPQSLVDFISWWIKSPFGNDINACLSSQYANNIICEWSSKHVQLHIEGLQVRVYLIIELYIVIVHHLWLTNYIMRWSGCQPQHNVNTKLNLSWMNNRGRTTQTCGNPRLGRRASVGNQRCRGKETIDDLAGSRKRRKCYGQSQGFGPSDWSRGHGAGETQRARGCLDGPRGTISWWIWETCSGKYDAIVACECCGSKYCHCFGDGCVFKVTGFLLLLSERRNRFYPEFRVEIISNLSMLFVFMPLMLI